MPRALAAGGKERHVARPEPALRTLVVGDEHLARDDVHHLVDRVVPVEASGGARPRHHGRGAVLAARQLARARLRLAGQNPRGMNRRGREIDVGGTGDDDRRHGSLRIRLGVS